MGATLLPLISQADPAVKLPRDGVFGESVTLKQSRILLTDLIPLVAKSDKRLMLSAGLKDSDRMLAIYGSGNVADLLEACADAVSLSWEKIEDGYRLSGSKISSAEQEEARRSEAFAEKVASDWSKRLLPYASLTQDQIVSKAKEISTKLESPKLSDAEREILEREWGALEQLKSRAQFASVQAAAQLPGANMFGLNSLVNGARIVSLVLPSHKRLATIHVSRNDQGINVDFHTIDAKFEFAENASTQQSIPRSFWATISIPPKDTPPIFISCGEAASRLSKFLNVPVVAWDSRQKVRSSDEMISSWNRQDQFISAIYSSFIVQATKSAVLLKPIHPGQLVAESPPERALRALEAIPTPSIEDAALYLKQCSQGALWAQTWEPTQSTIELGGLARSASVLLLWLQLDSPTRAALLEGHAQPIERLSAPAKTLFWRAIYEPLVTVLGRSQSPERLLLPPENGPDALGLYVTQEAKVTFSYRVGTAIVEGSIDQIPEAYRQKATQNSKKTYTIMLGRNPKEAAIYEFSLPVARPVPTKSSSSSAQE